MYVFSRGQHFKIKNFKIYFLFFFPLEEEKKNFCSFCPSSSFQRRNKIFPFYHSLEVGRSFDNEKIFWKKKTNMFFFLLSSWVGAFEIEEIFFFFFFPPKEEKKEIFSSFFTLEGGGAASREKRRRRIFFQ